MENDEPKERRKFDRSEFAYPVEIKILSEPIDKIFFKGYIEDISMGGARIQFEDNYGRLNNLELSDTKIKIIIFMPDGEKISVLSSATRVNVNSPEQFFVEIGIKFEDFEEWQQKAIKKLIRSKRKDQNMMWNLWGQFEKKL